ncbi:GWxTD domain-containing protein [candidate division KSB1 bacterium]
MKINKYRICNLPVKIFLLSVLILVSFLSAVNTYAQDAKEYYELGIKLREEGKIDDAIDAFKNATFKDRNFADAYYELALTYLEKIDENQSFRLATDAIEEALFHDRTNKDYNIVYADIYAARGNYNRAKKILDDIILEYPNDISILKRLSNYYLQEYRQNQYRNDRISRQFNIPESLLKKVEDLYERILVIDPFDKDIIFNKAILFLDNGDLNNYLDYLQKLYDGNEDDRELNLFIGLGYSRQGKNKEAKEFYEKAISQMNDEERLIFDSPEYFLSSVEIDNNGDFEIIPGKNVTQYWEKIDPLYLTEINERKNEHFARVAEANLRFSVPSKDIPGWKTARGYIWIKYGRPDIIDQEEYNNARYANVEDRETRRFLDNLFITRPMANVLFGENVQVWVYSDFRIVFYAGKNAKVINEYKFKNNSPYSRNFGNFEEVDNEPGGRMERLIDSITEIYDFQPEGGLFKFFGDLVTYKGESDKTEVELYYGVPMNKIGWDTTSRKIFSEYDQGIYFHDKTWDRIFTQEKTRVKEYDPGEIDPESASLLIEKESFEIEPGSYDVSIEIMEAIRKSAGIARGPVTIPEYKNKELQMSDILVAYSIEIEDLAKPLYRDNLNVVGNPQHSFAIGNPIEIYYEVYNLFVAGENSENHYKIEYNLQYRNVDVDIHLLNNRLLENKPFSVTSPDQVWVSGEIRGVGNTDYNIMEIQNDIEYKGLYMLTIRITDQVSGETTQKSTPIRIFRPVGK